MNDVYLGLDDLRDDPGTLLPKAAARALACAVDLLRQVRSLPGSETLQASVSIFVDAADEDFAVQGARIRFFTRRGDHPDWFEDLETFASEAIAVLDLTDIEILSKPIMREK